MLVYIAILIWILLINGIFRTRRLPRINAGGTLSGYNVEKAQVFLTMGMLVFFVGLRSAGADTEAYIRNFNTLPTGIGELLSPKTYVGYSEWIFRALGIFCKTISENYHLYLFVIASISGILVASTLKRVSNYYAESIILFMLMGDFTWLINGVRQFLAVSILFYASRYIEKKQTMKFMICLLIAMFIHNSAFFMFPIYFVVQGKAWNKRTVFFMITGIISVIFINTFLHFLDSVMQGTVYDGYIERFDSFGGGSSFIRTVIYAVPPVLAFMKRKEITKEANPFINLAINMSVAGAVVSLIANFTSGILVGRIPIYFSVYNLALLPWLLRSRSYKNNRYLPIIMYVCYSFIFIFFTNFYYYSDLLFGGRVIPRF